MQKFVSVFTYPGQKTTKATNKKRVLVCKNIFFRDFLCVLLFTPNEKP